MIKNLLSVLKLIENSPRCIEQFAITGPIARLILLFFIISQGISSNAYTQELSQTEAKIVEYIEQNSEQALALLEEVVNINSGTLNNKGVRQVGMVFKREFEAIGFTTKWVNMPDSVNRGGSSTRENSIPIR
jgi:glutamate carboxypeptidase